MGVSVSIFNGYQYGKLVSAQYIWNPDDDTPGPRARDAISPPVQSITQTLMAPLAKPQLPTAIQASVWIPRSTNCLLVWSKVNA